MAESHFCLAPTGDSKGFTARFYYALMHGCIPVRLDAWYNRRLPLEGLALPFASLLNWSRLFVNYDSGSSARLVRNGTLLLTQLRDMPAGELQDRIEAVHEAAHWLSYDRPAATGGQDAPSALLLELQQRAARLKDPAAVAALVRRQAEGERAACEIAIKRGSQRGITECQGGSQNVTDD